MNITDFFSQSPGLEGNLCLARPNLIVFHGVITHASSCLCGCRSGGQNIVVTSEIAFRIVDYMVPETRGKSMHVLRCQSRPSVRLKANESTDQNIKEILRRASTLSNAGR